MNEEFEYTSTEEEAILSLFRELKDKLPKSRQISQKKENIFNALKPARINYYQSGNSSILHLQPLEYFD